MTISHAPRTDEGGLDSTSVANLTTPDIESTFHKTLLDVLSSPTVQLLFPKEFQPVQLLVESQEFQEVVKLEQERIAQDFIRRKRVARSTLRKGKTPQKIVNICIVAESSLHLHFTRV